MRSLNDNRDRLGRAAVVVVLALAVAPVTWFLAEPRLHTSDFHFFWYASNMWRGGIDPYLARPGREWHSLWPLWDRFFYPGPALLLVWPFVQGSIRVGHVLFVTAGAALLAWRLTRDSLWPLLFFLTPTFWMAAMLGQWAPWLTLAALTPSLGFLFAAKPTLGLACFTYRPTWRAVWTGALLTVVSVLLLPRWPREWLDNLHTVRDHPAPIATPLGFLLSLAALRWRRREARFLLAMSCVPQLLFFSDQTPLFLVATSWREAALILLASIVAFAAWVWGTLGPSSAGVFHAPYVMIGCYLPCLYLILCRPNVGAVPEWIEQQIRDWPAWIRGSSENSGATASTGEMKPEVAESESLRNIDLAEATGDIHSSYQR
jgi:hypothetical protein